MLLFSKQRKLKWRETPYLAQIKAKNPVHGIVDEEVSIGVVAVSMQCSSRQDKAIKVKVQMDNPLQ